MRILTSLCWTTILLPLAVPAAQANPSPNNNSSLDTQDLSVSLQQQVVDTKGLLPDESHRLKQTQFNTQAASLTPLVAQAEPESTNVEPTTANNSWTESESVDRREVQDVLFQLHNISDRNFAPDRGSPALTIASPYGFGADRGMFYSGLSYQSRTRYANQDDGTMGFGYAFGNSRKAVGVELGYTLASFGNNRDFGTGSFNTKIHHQFARDWGIAFGWNGFLNIGDDANDLEDSLYLTTTKVFRTRENLDSAFSRLAVTVGLGNGQFRSEDDILDNEGSINIFSSLAFRIANPVSGIIEWTGQDLAIGTSVSPFRSIPVTFNLALRDIAGAGDGARFIFGVGAGF